MPYRKDAPSVKPEVFLSLSAPFRLLRADRVYGYGHYVFNILRSTLTCLIQTGESCCLRFVGDSRADVIRVHAFLPLWFQSTDPVPDWSCSSYSRVSCPADGRACFVRSLAGRARGEALRQGAGESLGSARGVESRGERRVRAAVFRCRARQNDAERKASRRGPPSEIQGS